jgi:hypothetical protein
VEESHATVEDCPLMYHGAAGIAEASLTSFEMMFAGIGYCRSRQTGHSHCFAIRYGRVDEEVCGVAVVAVAGTSYSSLVEGQVAACHCKTVLIVGGSLVE